MITVFPATSTEGATEQLTSVELCAGAGGQAFGLEQAGFAHQGLVELDADACRTLRRNGAGRWPVIQADLAEVDGCAFGHVDLLAGGLPCPPFTVAGKQLGHRDERDLFPQELRLAEQISPRAVLLETSPVLPPGGLTATAPRSCTGSTAWAIKPGGNSCTPASMASRSCGRGSCWWRSNPRGRRGSAGPGHPRRRPRSARRWVT